MKITILAAALLGAGATAHAETLYFSAPIDGAQANACAGTGSPGTGLGLFTLDTVTNEVTYLIAYADLAGTETVAHVHGAPACVNGGVVYALPAGNPKSGSASISAVQAGDMVAGNHYVNIHSDLNPGGEIRGQVNPLGAIVINEVRIDQPSSDDDEYFELAGAPGTALDGLTYLVIGDGTGGSGTIENVTPLDGSAINAAGFFVAAESTLTLGTADLTTSLNFENGDNVTHLLVMGFTGANGDDLDTDDDGVLDVTPWLGVLDAIGLIEETNPPTGTEYSYGADLGFEDLGPDGTFVPGHAYRCTDAGTWTIGLFDHLDPNATDTVGAANLACPAPPCTGDIDGDGNVGFTDLTSLLAGWGPCPKAGECPADFDDDGNVGFTDLTALLANWGPCDP